jgi:hypothetical protein
MYVNGYVASTAFTANLLSITDTASNDIGGVLFYWVPLLRHLLLLHVQSHYLRPSLVIVD